jgi:uncharacterized membrane protein
VRERFWEIDILRGVAVIAMVLYHFSYDLAYFVGLFDVGFFRSGVGLNTGRMIGGTFIFLAGLSLTLSYGRAVVSQPPGGTPGGTLFWKYLGRGLRIFSYGLLITLFTWIFVPNEMIVFGILHLIGASIVLAYPFLRLRLANVALGLICIAVGLYLHDFGTTHPWLAWMGIRPNFFMLDYWPIFPWFGVMLLGLFAGNALYGDVSKQAARTAPRAPLSRPLAFLGRHSLLVYFVHQPILIAALVLLGVARIP